MIIKPNRREFLKGAGAIAAASTLPLSTVELAFADPKKNFTFAYISDSHIQHINPHVLRAGVLTRCEYHGQH